LLRGHDDTLLVIDESGIPKKGKHSAGVARQYCGQLGKVENCQVGVYGALAHRDKVTLTDGRLFVPREWTNDPERCRRAGIPEEIWRTPKTKFDLVLEIVIQAVEEGIRFKWVSADGAYGENAFLLPLDDARLQFIVDVHCDHLVWFEAPTGSRRRRVDEWAASQPASAWQEVTTLEGTGGAIRYEVLHARVWIDVGRKQTPREWHLLVRREIETPRKIKYTLSNAPADMPLDQLAYIQGQRYWVERALQDAKSHSGLGDYQVRGWLGWHHHMASCSWRCCSFLKSECATALPRRCSVRPISKKCSSTSCHAATPPTKSSSACYRRVMIDDNERLPPTASDLCECDKVELGRQVHRGRT
jgi:SRSO17 transposase